MARALHRAARAAASLARHGSRRAGPRALRVALGARRPLISGRLAVDGLRGEVVISRDRFGVPYVRAAGEHDVWFGQGFCHAQDRGFQLEAVLRVGRGTLAELVGPPAVAVDRFTRRVGLHRAARRHLPRLGDTARATIEAYAAGINAAHAGGAAPVPHELALLRARPSAWTATDVLAYVNLQALSLNGNWRTELGRLRLLAADGADALRDLDAACRRPGAVDPALAAAAMDVSTALLADAEAVTGIVPAAAGGGSNGIVVAGARTASGRPIMANDLHLPPGVPSPVYLVHLRTDDWAAAGGSFVGAPGVVLGHNGTAAWGLTAGLVDLADLFIEELGEDGVSVRQGGEDVPCRVERERIAVRGAEPIDEDVVITPRGPIVGPAPAGGRFALSLRATWHEHPPVELELAHQRARSLGAFTAGVTAGTVLSLHWVYADGAGGAGRALGGRVPRRRTGHGLLPRPGWDLAHGWEDGLVPPEAMPAGGPDEDGVIVCANDRPPSARDGAYLGVDFADDFRALRLRQALAERSDWDVDAVRALQLDSTSLPWAALRARVLSLSPDDDDALLACDLLATWDGEVSEDSPAAAVFEVFVAELARAVAHARAPHGAIHLLGAAVDPLSPTTLMSAVRVGHLVRVLDEHPDGWVGRPWPELMSDALAAAVARLRARGGPRPASWAWGRVRPLRLRHPFGERRGLAAAFDLGPFAWGGETHTPSAAVVSVLDPLANPELIAVARFSVEAGDWEGARWVLPGGQSGNPCSPHYADQLPLWRRGDGVPIAWSEAAVEAATTDRLVLSAG
jgi:penicillin G amidase